MRKEGKVRSMWDEWMDQETKNQVKVRFSSERQSSRWQTRKETGSCFGSVGANRFRSEYQGGKVCIVDVLRIEDVKT